MKKFLFIILIAVINNITTAGQNAIEFLGIPVDGTREEMVRNIVSKGFTYHDYAVVDGLFGEFNGEDVIVRLETVNGRVYRVTVSETTIRNRSEAKIHFNDLYKQFINSGKYTLAWGKPIDENVDITYEINAFGKRFDVGFSPKDKSVNGRVWYSLVKIGGRYSIVIYYENLDNAANGSEL